jgi:hypothetical protein
MVMQPAPTFLGAAEDAVVVLRSRLKGRDMNSTARIILIVVLVVLLIGLLPAWPYSGGFGYYPMGGVGLLLMIVIALILLGKL